MCTNSKSETKLIEGRGNPNSRVGEKKKTRLCLKTSDIRSLDILERVHTAILFPPWIASGSCTEIRTVPKLQRESNRPCNIAQMVGPQLDLIMILEHTIICKSLFTRWLRSSEAAIRRVPACQSGWAESLTEENQELQDKLYLVVREPGSPKQILRDTDSSSSTGHDCAFLMSNIS